MNMKGILAIGLVLLFISIASASAADNATIENSTQSDEIAKSGDITDDINVTFDEKMFKGLKVVKTGLYVGDIKPLKSGKTVFEPSNSIALSLERSLIRDDSYLALPRNDDRLIKYLRGETIPVSREDGLKASGMIIVGIGDYPLGFAKINGSTAKNMYPKAWRLI